MGVGIVGYQIDVGGQKSKSELPPSSSCLGVV